MFTTNKAESNKNINVFIQHLVCINHSTKHMLCRIHSELKHPNEVNMVIMSVFHMLLSWLCWEAATSSSGKILIQPGPICL